LEVFPVCSEKLENEAGGNDRRCSKRVWRHVLESNGMKVYHNFGQFWFCGKVIAKLIAEMNPSGKCGFISIFSAMPIRRLDFTRYSDVKSLAGKVP